VQRNKTINVTLSQKSTHLIIIILIRRAIFFEVS
jgi:hypothetical protein